MLFNSWIDLERTLVIGVLAYVALVLLLRISGKRTLSKMNAFDLIVTIALGSTLASSLLSKDVALVQAVLAFALLILLQFIITWLSVRSSTVRHVVKATPALLLYQGQFLHHVMKAQRVTEGEVRTAIREQNIASIEDVEAVVLETEGSLTVLPCSKRTPSSLANVGNYPPEQTKQASGKG